MQCGEIVIIVQERDFACELYRALEAHPTYPIAAPQIYELAVAPPNGLTEQQGALASDCTSTCPHARPPWCPHAREPLSSIVGLPRQDIRWHTR
eukprot:1450439-Amphidinium_carterae.1